MIYYPFKSSDQIKYKPALSKKIDLNQQIAVKKILFVIGILKKKFDNKNLIISWDKINSVKKKSVRFFSCIQNMRTKIVSNVFISLKAWNNNKLKIKATRQQLLKYPIILLDRIFNNSLYCIKKQVIYQLQNWKQFSKRKESKIIKIKEISVAFLFRNVIFCIYRKKKEQQLKNWKRQSKKNIILTFCSSQKLFVMNLMFEKTLNLCLNQIILQKTQQKNRKRQEKQLLNIKRNQSLASGKNKISQLKAQLQQNQSYIHKQKQIGKYQSSIMINKKKQQYKNLEEQLNSLKTTIQVSKLALYKKNDSLKQRHLKTIQIQKVFELFQFIKRNEAQNLELKNIKGKINQNMLNIIQQSKQLKCLQNIQLQNIVALYEGRLNQKKGQAYIIVFEENVILNNILISLISLEYYRKQNNQQIKNTLSMLQETSSNLQLIKRKHNLNNKF